MEQPSKKQKRCDNDERTILALSCFLDWQTARPRQTTLNVMACCRDLFKPKKWKGITNKSEISVNNLRWYLFLEPNCYAFVQIAAKKGDWALLKHCLNHARIAMNTFTLIMDTAIEQDNKELFAWTLLYRNGGLMVAQPRYFAHAIATGAVKILDFLQSPMLIQAVATGELYSVHINSYKWFEENYENVAALIRKRYSFFRAIISKGDLPFLEYLHSKKMIDTKRNNIQRLYTEAMERRQPRIMQWMFDNFKHLKRFPDSSMPAMDLPTLETFIEQYGIDWDRAVRLLWGVYSEEVCVFIAQQSGLVSRIMFIQLFKSNHFDLIKRSEVQELPPILDILNSMTVEKIEFLIQINYPELKTLFGGLLQTSNSLAVCKYLYETHPHLCTVAWPSWIYKQKSVDKWEWLNSLLPVDKDNFLSVCIAANCYLSFEWVLDRLNLTKSTFVNVLRDAMSKSISCTLVLAVKYTDFFEQYISQYGTPPYLTSYGAIHKRKLIKIYYLIQNISVWKIYWPDDFKFFIEHECCVKWNEKNARKTLKYAEKNWTEVNFQKLRQHFQSIWPTLNA